MSKTDNLHDYLSDLADAIREKKGTSGPINAQSFAEEIRTIESGGETKYEFGETMVDGSGMGIMNLKNIVVSEGVTSLAQRAYYMYFKLQQIHLPNSLIDLGGGDTFYQCESLQSIIFPNAIKKIVYECCQNCYALASIHFPQALTQIDGYAFKNCRSLEQIRLPSGCSSIAIQAFNSCTKLSTIIIEAQTPPTLQSAVFDNNASGRLFYVPDASVDAYKAATNWSTYADQIKGLSELPNE